MDKRSSARFVAEDHRQLTAAGSFKICQLTAEGYLNKLLVFLGQTKCVNINFLVYLDMSQNQNQGNVQGDEKNKEKSPMTWHEIICNGSEKKKGSKVPVYN
ncbi:hypothetical protein MTR_6g085030 [Medicago truncatula]|uniref:Uncharacterized protein n=1 Tax=Medicago truncatula TaxID=3880 RepID=A0A072UC82_MEDTR|nr:hypothetical protein MTR_6g085030 [Medicago truncatula]